MLQSRQGSQEFNPVLKTNLRMKLMICSTRAFVRPISMLNAKAGLHELKGDPSGNSHSRIGSPSKTLPWPSAVSGSYTDLILISRLESFEKKKAMDQ